MTSITEVLSTSFGLIPYGTVLVYTAVLSIHLRIVCFPVCYYNTVLYNAACVHAVSLKCAKNI